MKKPEYEFKKIKERTMELNLNQDSIALYYPLNSYEYYKYIKDMFYDEIYDKIMSYLNQEHYDIYHIRVHGNMCYLLLPVIHELYRHLQMFIEFNIYLEDYEEFTEEDMNKYVKILEDSFDDVRIEANEFSRCTISLGSPDYVKGKKDET